MKTRKYPPIPALDKLLHVAGENIKLARLRRRLRSTQVAERAGLSRTTLVAIEKGAGSVAIGAYLQVLFVLGLEKDFLKIGADDALGRKLQDAKLIVRERAKKKKKDA